ncbi:MAG TPA: peptidase M48 [Erysipelotrichaceae bacterium]|nr:peptidase M48 [Erysipelotrichaceae bacterium]
MKLFILFVLVATFVFEWVMSTLNYQHRTQPIPDNVRDVYDPQEYSQWLEYTMLNHRLSNVGSGISFGIMLVLLSSDFFLYVHQWTMTISNSIPITTLLFLGVYMFISLVINLPFDYVSTFVIDQKFGFNTSTLTTFVLDKIKGLLLTVILGGALGYLLITLYLQFQLTFILIGWGVMVLVVLLVNVLYTKVFIRLFNKLTPLQDSTLKARIEVFAQSVGYEVTKISVMNASKRSTKLNAFFSGFGKFKQIVLYDTLIEQCSEDEIVAVLAHEIGHAKHKDVIRSFAQSVIMLFVYLVVLVIFFETTYFVQPFGFSEPHIGFSMILFSILMSPIGIVLQLPLSYLSRKAEFKADYFAKVHGYGPALVSALKLLAKKNFSNLTPHPWVVKLSYSHPPMSKRIEMLSK